METLDWWSPVTEGGIAMRHAWCLPIQKLTKRVTSCCASWVRAGARKEHSKGLSRSEADGLLWGYSNFVKSLWCQVTLVILHGVVSPERPGGYLSLDHSGVICRREAEGEGVERRG